MTGDSNIGLVSAKELCDLIKTCAKNGVNTFHIGNIKLEFGQGNQPTPNTPIPEPTIALDETQAVKISAEAERQMSFDRLQQEVDELKLSDPLAYEKFIEGEIGDVGGRSEAT